ncbi:DUF2341 domain-containing protein [Desertivirga brevis]|uniref:DUF2341 domain-containing protein n=1 Tax=Desertivirga brevis TaxID=2810310 RepID=UPI001A9578EC|nr:DUF2341 domain-containing protein [Pedobacter sp. SYSU D00873]
MNLNTRLILIFAGIFMPLLSMAQYYGNYSYRKQLTLNTTTYVSGNADLINFPVLISITDNDLIRQGKITDKLKSATANDIAFTDAAGDQSSELNYQIESYDAATGTLKVWVRIPTLKKASNNVLYFYFGSPAPPAHPAAKDTWTSDYKAVFHFNEGSVSTTSGGVINGVGSNNGTLSSNTVTLEEGKIGKGYRFTGSQNIVTASSVASSNTRSPFTMSAWIKPATVGPGIDQKVMSNFDGNNKGFKMGLYYSDNKTKLELEHSYGGFGNKTRDLPGGTDLKADEWYFVQTVGEGETNANIRTYVNGVLDRSNAAGSDGNLGSLLYIASGSPSEGADLRYFKGMIDEVRVSGVAKSADWIKTEYNNQAGISGTPFIKTYGTVEVLASQPTAPVDVDGATNEISEFTTDGATVGLTIHSSPNTPTNNELVTYYLEDDAGGRFAINSTTGVVTVANAGLIDYENSTSHSITVLAYNTYTTSSASFVINVKNETEEFAAPKDVNPDPNTVPENSAAGTTVGVKASAENGGKAVVYSLTDDVGGRFAIDANSGLVTVKNGLLIDYEANPSYTIIVKATSDGEEKSSSFTITVTDVFEASTGNSYSNYLYRKKLTLNANNYVSGSGELTNFPVLLEIHDTDLKHTGSASDKVKSATANDIAFKEVSTSQISGGELSYQIENYDAANGILKVWVKIPSLKKSINNEIYLYFGSSNPTTHSSQDTWGSDYRAVFHFNESTYTTKLGGIKDGKGLNNATLTSNTNNLTSGIIGSAYNFNGSEVIKTINELPTTTNFTISAWISPSEVGVDRKVCSNQGGDGKGYKMGVYSDRTAESEFNLGHNYSTRHIGSPAPLSTGNWYFLQTVMDGTDLKTYLNGQLYRSQSVNNSGTVGSFLYIGNGAPNENSQFDYKFRGLIDEFRVSSVAKSPDWIATEYNIQRYPSNLGTGLNGGSTFISSYGSLENVNSAPSTPTDISSLPNEVPENSENGTLVGLTVSAVDPDQNPVTYSLTDDAGGRFTINSSTGVVSVANKALLNYEKAQSHTITVQASDGYYTSSQTFTIALLNVDEPLSDIVDKNAAVNVVSESVRKGAVVPITAYAEHQGAPSVSFTLVDDAGGRFKIDPTTGVVTVASSLDFETASSHTITVKADDGTKTITQDFTISVTDFNEFSTKYAFIKTVNLNNGDLGISSSLTNFPALLTIQDDNLKLSNNCVGAVNSSSYPDIAIVDPSYPEQLNYEIQGYDAITGTIRVRVKLPSLSATPNSIYVYFGTEVADATHTPAFTAATYIGEPSSPSSDWNTAKTYIEGHQSVYTSNGSLEVDYEKAELMPGALTYTWTGAVSTDPSAAGNWTCTTSGEDKLLPANNGNVTLVIPAGASTFPVLTADLKAYGLTIASGASLSLNGKELYVKCDFYNNGSLLYNDKNSSALNFNGALTEQKYIGNATTNGQVGKLVINNSGGDVTLSGGGLDVYYLVEISRNTLNSNGFLNLKASATTTAAVAPLLSGTSIVGNVNAEIFFTGGGYEMRGARSFSSPVKESSSSTTYQKLQQSMIITGPGGASNGFDPGGALRPDAATLTRYWEPAKVTQSQFVDVANIKEALPPGFGVFVYYRGDRSGYTRENSTSSYKLKEPFANPESTAVRLEGTLNQGDVRVDFTFTDNKETARDGFNLIGNPYQAVIDWETVEKSGVGTQLVVAKPKGGFATYLNGVTVNASDKSTYTGGTLRYIQPGLAFYAKATGSGSYVKFKESDKVISTGTETPAKLLSTRQSDLSISIPGVEKPSVKAISSTKILRMNLEGKSNIEEAVVLFNPSFNSKAVVNEDATAFGSSTVTFSSLSSDNVRLVINALPSPTTTTIIPLNVNAESTEDVKLSFTDLSALGNSQMALVDNYLNKTVEVTSTSVSYPFTIDKSVAASYGTGRLKLIISPPSVLPLQKGSFVAKKQNNEVKLSWTTLSENGSKEFLIEKSLNGLEFTELNRVKASGTSSVKRTYSLSDQNPAEGINYYRLTLLNENDESAYTSLAFINYSLKNNAKVSLYPNPASNVLNVVIDKAYSVKHWSIVSPEGKIIRQKQVDNNHMLPLNVADLKPGVYILDLRGEVSEIIARLKFIKN